MSYIVKAHVHRNAEGSDPLPSVIGPFPTREAADAFMESQSPLWGHWSVSPVCSPDAVQAMRGTES